MSSVIIISGGTTAVVETQPIRTGNAEGHEYAPFQSTSIGLIKDEEATIIQGAVLENKGSDISDTDIKKIINTIYLEKHLEEATKKFAIWHSTWSTTVDENYFQVSFTVPQSISENILHHLQTCGIGTYYESSICISAANVYLCGKKPGGGDNESNNDSDGDEEDDRKKKTKWNNFVASIKSRLTVAQVVQTVRNNAAISFDYITLIVVAAIIATLGLLENNSVNLVASMLISPLMGPIIAFVFGSVINDKALISLGLQGGTLGIMICIVVGMLTGIFIQWKPVNGPWANVEQWPTFEMLGRTQYSSLIVGAFVAIPSGVGVALSILAGNAGSLVGVAISASLLPPAVNCGILWGMAFVISLREATQQQNPNFKCDHEVWTKDDYWIGHENRTYLYCKNTVKEYTLMGTVSLCLTLLNIFLIFVFGFIILRIKEFAPYTTRKNLNRFWKEDLKNVREYNATHGGVLKNEDIIDDINKVENPADLKNTLEQDATLNTVNRRTGANLPSLKLETGQVASPSVLATAVDQAPPPPTPKRSGWFSGWFGKTVEEPVVEAPAPETERSRRRVVIRRPMRASE